MENWYETFSFSKCIERVLRGENNHFLFKSRSAQELSSQFVTVRLCQMWGFPPWPCQTSSAPCSPCALMSGHIPHLSPKGNPEKGLFIYWAVAGRLRGWHRLPQHWTSSPLSTWLPQVVFPAHLELCPPHLHLAGIFRKSFRLMFCAATLWLLAVNTPLPQFLPPGLPTHPSPDTGKYIDLFLWNVGAGDFF